MSKKVNYKGFQKKVLKLINSIRKCDVKDLQLFVALCLIRFDNLDTKDNHFNKNLEDSTNFEIACVLSRELFNDNNIRNLLY